MESSSRPGVQLTDAQVRRLSSALRGRLLLPRDGEFEAARSVWNGMISRRPAAIARCESVGDVVAAVSFARDEALLLAVRGGGHSVAGNGVCDDGLVIDLSQMRGVEVDAAKRRARAQGGARWGDLDRATQAVGLATTGGEVSTTGIAGLTLGGGFGWLMGKCGLACDNLVEAEVVCADGRVLTTSETEHPELLWALRGGGGNFGVVTRFVYALVEIDRPLAGTVLYPLSRAAEFLERYRDCTAQAPDDLTIMAALLTTPDLQPAVGAIVCHCGDAKEGERMIAPLRTMGGELVDTIAPMAYTDLQSMLDASVPSGRNNYWKASFVPALGRDLIDVLSDRAACITSPLSSILIEHLHGAVCRVAPEATAFGLRSEQYSVGMFSAWIDPAESGAHQSWTRETFAAVEPHSAGASYVNYLGEDSAAQIRASFGANYPRLVEVKRQYDPDNLFRVNFNISPR